MTRSRPIASPLDAAATVAFYVEMFCRLEEINRSPPKYFAVELIENSFAPSMLAEAFAKAGRDVAEFGSWRDIRVDRAVYFARDRQWSLALLLFQTLAALKVATPEAKEVLYRFDALFAEFNGDVRMFRSKFDELIAARAWRAFDG